MRNLTETDDELLSSYIDGELSDAERMALETRLNAEDDLRRELATLRQTVALVNQLPKLKAPRNFTLEKPVMESRTIPFPMTAAFSALSAAAAVLLIVFGGYLLTFSGNRLATPQAAFEPGQVAQAPTVITAAQDLFESNQAFTPTGDDNLTNEAENQDALESAVAEEAETPVADSLPFAIALPTMTQAVETGTSGQGGAGADQSAETEFFAVPAETQPPPSASMDSAAPITMQQAADSTAEERDDETANSAAGLTLASSPEPTATSTPMPTAVAQESANDASVQRAAEPTQAPVPPVPPTPIPQQKVEVEFDSSLVGLLSMIVGIVLLVAALATTLARRRRKMA